MADTVSGPGDPVAFPAPTWALVVPAPDGSPAIVQAGQAVQAGSGATQY